MKTALITGATSGIGLATARLLAKNGFKIVACGRREDRLYQLRQELQGITPIHTIAFDVRDKEMVQYALGQLPAEFAEVDVLVNNAGNAYGMSPIQDGELEDWDAMVDINVKGLLYVSRAIIPGMVARGGGHIINLGSIAGKETYPNGAVYCASKAAVDAISEGMRMDLLKNNIRVSAIHPGLVETEFSVVRFKGDEERAKNVYKGIKPLTGDDIADIIHFVVTRPYHVNIADLVVFPTAQASATLVNRV